MATKTRTFIFLSVPTPSARAERLIAFSTLFTLICLASAIDAFEFPVHKLCKTKCSVGDNFLDIKCNDSIISSPIF